MNKRYWTYNGITKTNGEWAREYGMTPEALYARIRRGWSIDKALHTPIKHPHTYMYGGVPMTISELSSLSSAISRKEMYKRIAVLGWPIRCAIYVRNLNDVEREYSDLGYGIRKPTYCTYPKCDLCPYPECVS